MFQEHRIAWTDEKVARLWDYYARTPPFPDIYFARQLGPELLRRSRLPFDRDVSVLDFGCGPGYMWDNLQALGSRARYTGLDFSAESVAALRRRAGADARFRGAIHVSQLPSALPGDTFDLCLLVEVVEHLEDAYLAATLDEIRRVLKPGGVVLVSTPNEEDLGRLSTQCPDCGCIFNVWQHVRSWSAGTLTSAMAAHGLDLVRAEAVNLYDRTPFHRMLAGARAWVSGRRDAPHLVAQYRKESP